MRGAGEPRRRRGREWVLACLLAALPVAVLAPAPPARADLTSVPGTMSTAARSTSSFDLPVPVGVEVRAIRGVLTMPEVVEGGTVTFRVNGARRKTVPSALYQKVRIPVGPADVVADGTIRLTLTSESPAPADAPCVPPGGDASLRKIELDYRGVEVAPTSLAEFLPPASAGITVLIPEDADDDTITAGLTAVAALVSRYDDETPVTLGVDVPDPAAATAGQRVVAIVPGRPGEVTTAVSTTLGIPLLTLTGAGDELVDAARALSTDALGLSGTDAENPSLETKPRSTDTTRTLEDLGVEEATLTGYGSVTERLELRQDSFGVPVSSMRLHLEGSHTAFPDASSARLDVRANGTLIGSTVLGEEARFEADMAVPQVSLRSVNDVELTLNALAPDGSTCTPPSIPPAEVDLDTGASTVTVEHGTGEVQGFQLFPQIYEGVLPVALRAEDGRRTVAAINAAALVAALQRSAASPLEIQLMSPDAFLADDRSGLLVGAVASDSEALDAPLELSDTRLLDRDDSVQEVTSQDPYAVLESIDRNNRLVLMLGSWAPGDEAAPGELSRKVVDAVVSTGWAGLDGDLVIADAANPAFVTASRSLAPHQATEEEESSYGVWFVVVIGILLVLLALQVWVAIRRDRQLAREHDDESAEADPAYVEDTESPAFAVDALGDVDDLQVHEHTARPRVGEMAPPADWEAWDDWGEEAEELGSEGSEAEPEPDEPEPEPEPEPKPTNNGKGKPGKKS